MLHGAAARRTRADPKGIATLEAFKRQQAALAEAQAARAAAGGRIAPHVPRKPQVQWRLGSSLTGNASEDS